jgi:hypothetical protein
MTGIIQTTTAGDMRAPIFYDRNNTAYFLNPTDGSQLYTVSLGAGQKLHLVSLADGNHFLRYAGTGFSGVTIDGAQLCGHQGGELATNIGSDRWSLRWDSSGNIFARESARAPIFYDSNDTAFYADLNGTANINRIDGNGKYAIGTSDSYLRINESSAFSNGTWFGGTLVRADGFYAGSNGGTSNSRVHIASGTYNGSRVIFLDGSNGEITAAGNITAYSSDRRLKTNIVPISSALDKVMSIGGYTFDWVDEAEELGFTPELKTNDAGVLAQEIQAVLPQAVAPAPFDWQWDDKAGKNISKSGENYLTVRYERIVPLLIEAIKEQQTSINRLQQQINSLKEDK